MTWLWCQLAKRHTFADKLKLNPRKMDAFVRAVEQGYRSDNSFHNATHAADTLHAGSCFLAQTWLHTSIPAVEWLSFFIACACHDLGHPGVSNGFMMTAGGRLAHSRRASTLIGPDLVLIHACAINRNTAGRALQ